MTDATRSSASIRTAHACSSDARTAVLDFHAAVYQPDMELVLFFCSSAYPLEVIEDELRRLFGDTRVIGCTTAGEIGPAGYREHSISGASFRTGDFTVASGLLEDLQSFEARQGYALAQKLLQELEHSGPNSAPANTFALQLIDGLSVREEIVTSALQDGLGGIQLIGGSAGGGLEFRDAHVFVDGRFHHDAAALILVNTTLPFRVFKTQHFVPTDRKVVVTAADAPHRVVTEIDGWPATEGYARLLGVGPDKLDPLHFAGAPMVVMLDGTNYVRSVQKANPDGSLTFFCAIEEGLVLRLARGVDLVENLEQALAKVREDIGPPQLVIGCDCILRKLEIDQTGLTSRVAEVLRRNNTVGFNTYGEQYHGVHVNQTLTAVAIGSGPTEN